MNKTSFTSGLRVGTLDKRISDPPWLQTRLCDAPPRDADLSKDKSGPESPPEFQRNWCFEGHARSGVISSVLMKRYQKTLRQKSWSRTHTPRRANGVLSYFQLGDEGQSSKGNNLNSIFITDEARNHRRNDWRKQKQEKASRAIGTVDEQRDIVSFYARVSTSRFSYNTRSVDRRIPERNPLRMPNDGRSTRTSQGREDYFPQTQTCDSEGTLNRDREESPGQTDKVEGPDGTIQTSPIPSKKDTQTNEKGKGKGESLEKSLEDKSPEKVVIHDDYLDQTIIIGGNLSAECRFRLVEILCKHADAFA
nr:hypothetical protein [Tanacetum cinerariifolium]